MGNLKTFLYAVYVNTSKFTITVTKLNTINVHHENTKDMKLSLEI